MAHIFPESSPLAGQLRGKLLQNRKKIADALEPELSMRIAQLIKHKYSRILEKVQLTRGDLERLGYSLKHKEGGEEFLNNREKMTRFY